MGVCAALGHNCKGSGGVGKEDQGLGAGDAVGPVRCGDALWRNEMSDRGEKV